MSANMDRILISIRAEPELGADLPEDLLYLSGNMEILVGDCMLVVGVFPGAILLLPSIDALADATRKVRDGHKAIEIILVGDTGSLWIFERKRVHSVGISFAYRSIETDPVTRSEIDSALEQSVLDFLND
jgi:hypothetical protein